VSDDANDKTIAALLRERAALTVQGKDERVAQVDAELQARGYEAPKGEEKKEAPKLPEDPKRQAPQGRSSRPQQTTTKD
jgi:hypothetical protein